MKMDRNPPIEMVPCIKCGAPSAFQNVDGGFCRAHWMVFPNPAQKADGFVAGMGGLKKATPAGMAENSSLRD